MLMSMTGFGRACIESKTRRIIVEIKSLNSKQLDMNVRIPFAFRECELDVRNIASRILERGKADVLITCENLTGTSLAPASKFNIETMAAYKKQIVDAAKALDIPTPSDWYSILLRFPDTVHTETAEVADEEERAVLLQVVEQAAQALMNYRRAEGQELEHFFANRISAIGELLQQVEPFEKERVAKIRQRLEEGIAKIPAVEIDKGRLEQELIFYIEKLDVNEEKQRLGKHLAYFNETMALPTPGQGKKLGFIAQEMGREINTLGSKSNHAEIQAIVVQMKDLLEQIKEQVLNVM